jgi:AraC-like DNA-binding protein
MDPLSDVLSLLKPVSSMTGGFDAGGEWSIQFPQYEAVRYNAVISGQCWLAMEGVAEPVLLKAGDCVVLPLGSPYRLASDLSLPPVDFKTMLSTPLNGRIALWNGGGDFFGVGGYFTLAGKPTDMLLGMLPPIVHIKNESDKAAIRWSMERMMQELREPQPGGFLVIQHLAQMMLVQVLRVHLTERPEGGVGWLFALADPRMGAAIGAIHDDPAHRWTLQELAELAGMSRSTFALKFKETVGSSPIEYLTRWRMMRAGDRLENSDDPISVIALALGYESESAFSTAFKRVMGCSPRRYHRGRTSIAAAQAIGSADSGLAV